MDITTYWTWSTRGLVGAVNITEMLAKEGNRVTLEQLQIIDQQADRLKAIVEELEPKVENA